MRRVLAATALGLVSASGCVVVGPSCGGPSATIIVTPALVIVSVGQSMLPHATWCDDGDYERVSPRWSLARSEDASIISLDAATGRITGRSAGQATVIAAYGGGGEARVPVTVR